MGKEIFSASSTIDFQPGYNPIFFVGAQTKQQLDYLLNQQFYWTVGDLEKRGALSSQEAWDTFKQSREFHKFEVPGLVKGVLMSRKIIP